jgi:hypothetical protein
LSQHRRCENQPRAGAFSFNKIIEGYNKHNVAKASFSTEPHGGFIIAFLGTNIVRTALAIGIVLLLVEHIADLTPIRLLISTSKRPHPTYIDIRFGLGDDLGRAEFDLLLLTEHQLTSEARNVVEDEI